MVSTKWRNYTFVVRQFVRDDMMAVDLAKHNSQVNIRLAGGDGVRTELWFDQRRRVRDRDGKRKLGTLAQFSLTFYFVASL